MAIDSSEQNQHNSEQDHKLIPHACNFYATESWQNEVEVNKTLRQTLKISKSYIVPVVSIAKSREELHS